MAPNHGNYSMSAPDWGGQNPHSPTTGAYQDRAGRGVPTERMARSQAVRARQMYELPVMTSPLQDVQPFVDAYRRAYVPPTSVARSAVVGGVLSAAITYAWRNR